MKSAFPVVAKSPYNFDKGMTLRDYFAIRVLIPFVQDNKSEEAIKGQVHAAYVYADAMLAEREKSLRD